MASYDKTIATAALLAASLMLVRSLASELLPFEAREVLSAAVNSVRSRLTWQHTIIVEEIEGWSYNHAYAAIKAYLATRIADVGASVGMQCLRFSGANSRSADRLIVTDDPQV